jgi:hypothetical protein
MGPDVAIVDPRSKKKVFRLNHLQLLLPSRVIGHLRFPAELARVVTALGGMNKVFLARFPYRVTLAKVMPYASYLPQLPPVPWIDSDGSLTSKWFGVSFSKPVACDPARAGFSVEPVLDTVPTSAMGHQQTTPGIDIPSAHCPTAMQGAGWAP